MHWGPYSVPGVSSEWFWYMVNTLPHPQYMVHGKHHFLIPSTWYMVNTPSSVLLIITLPSVEQKGSKQRRRHGNCEVSFFWVGIRLETLDRHMAAFYPPHFTYQQFGPQFRAEFFNATE